MSGLQGVAVVAVGIAGVVLAAGSLSSPRRVRLTARLDRYLGALGPRRSPLLGRDPESRGPLAALLRPVLEDLGARLQRLIGDDARDLERRLAAAGSTSTPSGFRAQQVVWSLTGAGAVLGLALLATLSGRAPAPVPVVGASIAGAVGGVLARDRRLTRAIAARRRAITAEFPIFVDLVCLGVTAGESLRGALELVSETRGELAAETRAALRDARTGRPMGEALAARAAVIGVPAVERFVGSVIVAEDRGVPLADALRAMAFDVRETEKRHVIEAGGRKQISMLVPVVGLILPVALVFAFYPGLIAIRTLSQ
jgi:tight adherence protein C